MPARKVHVRCWDLRQQPQHGGYSLYDLDTLPRERLQRLMCKNCFEIFTDSIPGVRMGDNRLNRHAQKAQHLVTWRTRTRRCQTQTTRSWRRRAPYIDDR